MVRNVYICIFLAIITISCGKNESPEVVIPENDRDDILLYSKNPKGHNELYKLDNGVETSILSNPEYVYWWPKVSPDKSKLLVYRSLADPSKNHDNYQNAELVLSNIDGSNPTVLIDKDKFGWRAQGVCRWNKDGTKILMGAEIETNGSYQWRVVLTDDEGENPKVLSDYWAIDCNFSPDDSYIYFMGFIENKLTTDLTKLELLRGQYDALNDTLTNIRAFTSNNSRDHDPDVSPDNTKIVFSAGNSDYTDVDLVLYDIPTMAESILLNDNNANGGSMCWSQDGKSIYFHSLELFKSPFRIKKINVETGVISTVLEVADNSYGFFHPEAY